MELGNQNEKKEIKIISCSFGILIIIKFVFFLKIRGKFTPIVL